MKNLISFLQKFIRLENHFQQKVGELAAWGMLSLILLAALVVILRYGFDTGSIALQEAVMYNHAILFMLGMGYTLLQNQHVRVDVFYANASPKRQAWIDLLGSLIFALPVMIFIFWSSWDYVVSSWLIHEASAEAGGLAYVYLLKTFILIMAVLMALQSLSLAAQSFLTLKGYPPKKHPEHTEGVA
jgi:TRAP-type mannitol/chloroaromatic compound transport system permease small subunit